MRKLWATAVLIIAFVVAFYITVTPATGSFACENDTGAKAYGLRVVFDRAVAITRMGSAFANWTTQENDSVILFWNGSMYPSGRFSFFWEPKKAGVLSYEWLPHLPDLAYFQKGNTQQLRHLVTTPAIETRSSSGLADNRIGGLWDGLSQPMDLQGILNNEILILGLKWVRLAINSGDWYNVDWNLPEFSILPAHDNWVTEIANNNITMMYELSFFDKASRARGEEISIPRFKTEEQIQRYLDFVQFIVRHFKDRIQYFEIWNEPNLDPGCIQYIEVSDYVTLVKRVIPVIRQEYPTGKIVVGATTNLREQDSQKYFFDILGSDIMTLVDAVSWHPMYGTSPEIEHYREYYYNYPSIVQEIKNTASLHGFKGEYMAEELTWRTPSTFFADEPWTYSDIVAAKYYARGILVHLGMDVAAGLGGFSSDQPSVFATIQNLCTTMAGHEAIKIPVEIDINYDGPVAYCAFRYPSGDRMLAVWTDGTAQDEDPGVPATITFPGLIVQKAVGIDVLHGFEQELSLETEGDSTIVRDLLIKDYPILIRLSDVTMGEGYQENVGDGFHRLGEPAKPDRDGDGVPDDEDYCPDYPGDPARNGC